MDEAKDAVVVINASGAILAVNRAAHALFGYDRGEMETKNISAMM